LAAAAAVVVVIVVVVAADAEADATSRAAIVLTQPAHGAAGWVFFSQRPNWSADERCRTAGWREPGACDETISSRKGRHVSKDQNSYAKRQREMNKKRKAEDKRVRRQKRKEQGSVPDAPDVADPSASRQ
jgi:predicted chitinase